MPDVHKQYSHEDINTPQESKALRLARYLKELLMLTDFFSVQATRSRSSSVSADSP
jgi:hypothetical protein